MCVCVCSCVCASALARTCIELNTIGITTAHHRRCRLSHLQRGVVIRGGGEVPEVQVGEAGRVVPDGNLAVAVGWVAGGTLEA